MSFVEVLDKNDSIQKILDFCEKAASRKDFVEWMQAVSHPESNEFQTWGSGSIIAKNPETEKFSKIGEFYDSCNLELALNAVNSIPELLLYVSQLQLEIIALKSGRQ